MPGAWGVHGKPPLLTARGRAPPPSPPRPMGRTVGPHLEAFAWHPGAPQVGMGTARRGEAGRQGGGREPRGLAVLGSSPAWPATPPWQRCSRVPHSPLLPWPSCGHQGGSRRGRQAWVAVCAPRCPWCECGLPKHKPLRASSVSGTSGPRTATSSCGSRRWAGHELAALSLGLWCDGSWSQLRTTRTDSVQVAKGGSGQPRSPRPPCLLRRVSAGPAAAPPPTAGSGRVQGHWGRGFWLYEVRRAPRLPCHPGGFIALVLEPVLSLVRTEKGA